MTRGIPESAVDMLTELADRDFRSPSHEAAALLTEAIERAFRRGRQTTGRARRELVVDAGEVER